MSHPSSSKSRYLPGLATLLIAWTCLAPTVCQAQEPEPTEQLLDYITRHGDRIAVVHHAVAEDGSADDHFASISHRGDLPLPLASTVKIVLLATYCREVATGRLNPAEAVTLADWQLYYHLAHTEHPESLADLGIATDPLGFAVDPTATVPLDAIARVMIRNSDNPATDYLLARLGRQAFEATVAEAGLAGQEALFSVTGFLMTLLNHEQGLITEARLRALLAMDRPTFVAEAERLADLYLDPAWRQAEILWLLETEPEIEPETIAALADVHFPKGIAGDYAQIMGEVVTGNFLSPTVSALMREHLEVPLEGTGLEELLFVIGSKGGDIDGTLTLAYYSVPRVGELAGQPVVSILFLSGLPPGSEVEHFGHPAELFIFRLWLDGTFAERVKETLCTPGSTTACLNDGRFRVRLSWQDHLGGEGVGRVVPMSSPDSALFWMFAPDNWELLIKVLDGCAINGHYWFFSAGATDVAYTLTVTDTALGVTREYHNFLGDAAPAIIDTAAFATCTGTRDIPSE